MSRLRVAARMAIAFLAPVAALSGCESQGRVYATPEAAVTALSDALSPFDAEKVKVVLGSRGADLLDPRRSSEAGAVDRFLAQFRERHALVEANDSTLILEVGGNAWPMPIPLVRSGSGWRWDTRAGEAEITARRIGRNELDVIQACLAIVDAQREYARAGYGGAPGVYAARMRSDPGKRNGLFWPPEPGVPESPLGEFAAHAAEEGAIGGDGARRTFYGYRFKLLHRQGPHAIGGAMDYEDSQERLTKGFAVVAWPARYGETGITTFMVNQTGVVFQRDLGPNTSVNVGRMRSFDPTPEWSVVEPWFE